MRLLNSLIVLCPEMKWGEPLAFINIHSVAKYQKNEGGPFGANKKLSKKSEKHHISQRGTLSMFSRFWTTIFFGLGSDVSSVLNLRSSGR